MKKNILVFGLLAGGIVSAIMAAVTLPMMKQHNCGGTTGMLIGYGSMLLAFCLIFVAIKNYRDKHLGGTITFGKAFTIGLGVAVIASVCYTITWVIVYKNFYPQFMDDYTSMQLAALQKSGKSASEIATEAKDIEKMKAMYNTWPGLIGMTLVEILPVGLLVALVSALILKRKQKAMVATPQMA